MSDDLALMIAERLREARFGWPFYVEREALDEAASALEAQAAEIARLRAACDASDERARAIELRFWQTVDRDGLTGLPSDMWAALNQLVQDRAALATARREGMEEAAQWHDKQAAQAQKLSDMKVSALDAKVWGDYATNHREYATAIRAAAQEGKP